MPCCSAAGHLTFQEIIVKRYVTSVDTMSEQIYNRYADAVSVIRNGGQRLC